MSELVQALWKGPSGWKLADGTELEQDTTVVAIGSDEADVSEFWERVPEAPAAVKPPKAAAKTDDDGGSN